MGRGTQTTRTILRSSMTERPAVNGKAGGLNPPGGAGFDLCVIALRHAIIRRTKEKVSKRVDVRPKAELDTE